MVSPQARYISFLLKNKIGVLWLIAGITLLFTLSLLNLRVNSSPYFLSTDHPSRIHEADIENLFTNSGEQFLVVLESHQNDVFELETLDVVRELTQKFQELQLIDQAGMDKLSNGERAYLVKPVRKVRSFTTLENLTSTEDEIDLHPLLPKSYTEQNQALTPSALSTFKQEVLANPLFKGLLISEDLAATSIQLELTIPEDNTRMVGKLYDKVNTIIESIDYKGKIYLAGGPVINAEMAKSMEHDNLVFFPFVMLIITAILFIGFRTWMGVLIPLMIAGVTAIWTMGLMVAMGIEQNIVTTILPVFLLTVAVADAIHFYNHYLLNTAEEEPSSKRLDHTFGHLLRPLVLTSITTLIGFLTLAWTELIFIKQFGLLMAIGVLFALLLTLILAPILVTYGPRQSRKELSVQSSSQAMKQSKLSLKIQTVISAIVLGVIKHPYKSVLLTIVCAALSIQALQNLQFDQKNIQAFDQDTVLRSHNDAILKHYDGTIPIDIWIDTQKQDGLHNPQVIQGIQKIEQYLHERSDIGFVLSPLGFLERMYNLLTNEGHRLPEDMSEGLIAQEILVYENEESQAIKHVIDDQHQHARIMVLGESDAASFWKEILKDLESMAPEGTTLEINGYGKVMYTNIEEVIKSHLTSTVLAVGLIGLVMILLFKSIQMGLIGILPLILTVMINFALMSALNIAVDVGTTIIASIAFGIGIDYSIHFLSTLKRLKESGQTDLEKMILEASQIVGMPILINSLTLAGGFLVLTVSSFQVLQVLGLFISMTMLLSAFNALILIPLAYYLWHRQPDVVEINTGSLAEEE